MINGQQRVLSELFLCCCQFYNVCMGLSICRASVQENQFGELDPILTTFSPIDYQVIVTPQHQHLLMKIKKKLDIVDCREQVNMNWYESPKYNLYLYGVVKRDRPFGNCFFYTKDPSIFATPLMIATTVSEHYVYSKKTLIVYPDRTIYYGAIKNNIAALPRAEGKGKLITTDYIYQGQFKNGYPHGYGNYRSKTFEYAGQFKNGSALGQGIAKSAEELFIGQISQNGERLGVKINKKNQLLRVREEREAGGQSKISLRSHLLED